MGDCSSKDFTHAPLAIANRGIVHELYVVCGRRKMNVYRDKESDLQMFNYCSSNLHRNTYHLDRNSIVFKEDSFAKRIKEVEMVEKTEDV